MTESRTRRLVAVWFADIVGGQTGDGYLYGTRAGAVRSVASQGAAAAGLWLDDALRR